VIERMSRHAAPGETFELASLSAPFGSVATLEGRHGLVSVVVSRKGGAAEALRREAASLDIPIRTVSAVRSPAALELGEHLAGKRRVFELELDFGELSRFSVRVLKELVKVPYGQTVSYGELAARAGSPRAARAVGRVMHDNCLAIVVPCHRVIASDGGLGGYSGGLEIKRWLFRREGIRLP
jgi:methylated-DNA-[protein]-cysteine S-methyltransferase